MVFQSDRLIFSTWSDSDKSWFSEMNADPEVMQYFPKELTKEESVEFLDRLQKHQSKHGYCYFKVTEKESNVPMGFIGLAYQEYKTEFTPAIDIGWRLKKEYWGKGYATEGAIRCLRFAFEERNISKVIAACILQNKPSEKVMQKIGMEKQGKFHHPRLEAYPDIQECVWYSKENESRIGAK